MKMDQLILTLGVIGLLTGCENKSDKSQPPAAPPAGTGEVRNLPPAALLTESKEQYLAAMEKRLALLNDQIEELAKKSETYTTEAKQHATTLLSSLREQRHAAQQTFEQVKAASAEGWTELKADFESVMVELEKAYASAKSKMS